MGTVISQLNDERSKSVFPTKVPESTGINIIPHVWYHREERYVSIVSESSTNHVSTNHVSTNHVSTNHVSTNHVATNPVSLSVSIYVQVKVSPSGEFFDTS